MILLDLFLTTAFPYFLLMVIPILTRAGELSFPIFLFRTIILKPVPENRFPRLNTS